MHRTVKPHPYHLGDAARIIAVRLVDLRLQCRLHVSRLDTDYRQFGFGQSAEQPLRWRSGFQSNPLEAVDRVLQNLQQSFRFACHLSFPHDPAVSSTMQMLVSLTDTSNPAKWSMLRFSF